MLNADQAPLFHSCPRCGVGGLERLRTHSYCINCNYDEIYSDELCVIPQWALKAVRETKATVRKLPTAGREASPGSPAESQSDDAIQESVFAEVGT